MYFCEICLFPVNRVDVEEVIRVYWLGLWCPGDHEDQNTFYFLNCIELRLFFMDIVIKVHGIEIEMFSMLEMPDSVDTYRVY